VPFLEMKGISKVFDGIRANDSVSLEVERGEVHTLLGENGAGKTTLMKILYGLYAADGGEIFLKGKPARILSPHTAIQLGIGMIHQHFMLVPHLSVTENIILGLRPSHPPWLALKEAEESIHAISTKYALGVNPKALVSELPVGLQQRVEILKALYRRIDLLILDEPTSVLTPLEVEALFRVIRTLTQDGLAVIFISHKLNEVMAISDRITVLRQGRVVHTVKKAETTAAGLANMMVGRAIKLTVDKPPLPPGKKSLQVCGISAVSEEGHKPVLKEVSFEVHEKEVFGIAGVDGNGQSELAEIIAGMRPSTKGEILISGVDATHLSTRQRINMGLSYIPADRQRVGLILDMSVAENLVLKTFKQRPFSKKGLLLSRQEVLANAELMIKGFDIKTDHGLRKVSSLSGGNQQKVVLAREVTGGPRVLLAVQPSRGLDIGSTKYVHQLILDHRARGGATLLISTELDEIIALCDRIAVIYEGQIMGIVEGGEAIDLEEVSLMMAGAKRQESQGQSR
jgi:general nucleoside transport system ATP-binding protein